MIVAHRGLTSSHLENSLEALNEAFLQGADGVEFDVQLSLDLVPLVFHDRSLVRLTGVENNIDHVASMELAKLRQIHERYSSSYRIATLEEVLSAMPPGKLINVELKETTAMKGLKGIKRVLEKIAPHKKRLAIVISSFEPHILEMVADLDSDYALGLLLDKKLSPLSWLKAKRVLDKVDYLHPHIDLLNPVLSAKVKKMGINLILWGHKKVGQEAGFIDDRHTALISDVCGDLLGASRA